MKSAMTLRCRIVSWLYCCVYTENVGKRFMRPAPEGQNIFLSVTCAEFKNLELLRRPYGVGIVRFLLSSKYLNIAKGIAYNCLFADWRVV